MWYKVDIPHKYSFQVRHGILLLLSRNNNNNTYKGYEICLPFSMHGPCYPYVKIAQCRRKAQGHNYTCTYVLCRALVYRVKMYSLKGGICIDHSICSRGKRNCLHTNHPSLQIARGVVYTWGTIH